MTCGTADTLSHEGRIEGVIGLEIRSREIAFNVASCQLRVLSGHGAMTLDARCALSCPLQGFLEDWTSSCSGVSRASPCIMDRTVAGITTLGCDVGETTWDLRDVYGKSRWEERDVLCWN